MNTSSKPQLIGIAGSLASGKDTLTRRLVDDFGYTHVSTSDIVRDTARVERNSVERPVLYEVAQEHRRRDGPGVFVLKALENPRPLIVSGLRSLGEAKAIRDAGGSLVFVDAPIEVRYERMLSRNRDAEVNLALEQFKANEQKEWHAGDDDADFNLRDIKQTADVIINNEYDLDSFIAEAYRKLGL